MHGYSGDDNYEITAHKIINHNPEYHLVRGTYIMLLTVGPVVPMVVNRI